MKKTNIFHISLCSFLSWRRKIVPYNKCCITTKKSRPAAIATCAVQSALDGFNIIWLRVLMFFKKNHYHKNNYLLIQNLSSQTAPLKTSNSIVRTIRRGRINRDWFFRLIAQRLAGARAAPLRRDTAQPGTPRKTGASEPAAALGSASVLARGEQRGRDSGLRGRFVGALRVIMRPCEQKDQAMPVPFPSPLAALHTGGGTAYWGAPKRFGAPAELTRLRLVPKRAPA